MKQPRHKRSDRPIPVDDVLLSVVSAVADRHAREDQLAGSPPSLEVGLPVPSLAVRYLLQNSGLPLGLVYHLVGPPAVFKSTLLAEMIRWHIACGGVGILCETETKPTPELRKSVIGWEDKRTIVRECTSVEGWQKTITDYIKAIQKEYSDRKEELKPIIFGIDSYMGKMPQRLQEKFARQGYAEKHFGEAAQIIGDWLSVYTALTKGWPFTLVGVNHLKKSIDPVTGLISYRTPGGQFLQHQNVTEIRVARSKTERKEADGVPYYETVIQLQTTKNSRGAQDKRIFVTLRQWREIKDNQSRLYSSFEWWESTVRMLHDGWGLTNSEREILLPKVKKILDIQKRSRGDLFWCDRLNIGREDAIQPHELGMILEQQEDLLQELYKVLEITQLQLFGQTQLHTESRLAGAKQEDDVVEIEEGLDDTVSE